MSGKGDDRRPLRVDEETFAANWDRIFTGARLGANSDSKPANDGSIPSAPANSESPNTALGKLVYVDNATGNEVSENWWPTIEEPK